MFQSLRTSSIDYSNGKNATWGCLVTKSFFLMCMNYQRSPVVSGSDQSNHLMVSHSNSNVPVLP